VGQVVQVVEILVLAATEGTRAGAILADQARAPAGGHERDRLFELVAHAAFPQAGALL